MYGISLSVSEEQKKLLKWKVGNIHPNFGKKRSNNTVNLIKKKFTKSILWSI